MQGKEHEDKEQEQSIKQYQADALRKFWTISLPLYWMTLQITQKHLRIKYLPYSPVKQACSF